MHIEAHTTFEEDRHLSTPEKIGQLTLFGLILLALLEPLTTINVNSTDGEFTGDGNALRQIAYFLIFSFALFSAGAFSRHARLRVLPKSIFFMLAWCAISIFWAIDPAVSARRFLLTAIVIYSVFLLVETVGYTRSVKTIRILLLLILMANFLAILGWHDVAVHQDEIDGDPSVVGAWYGILVQKNFAGAVCALTILFFIFNAREVGFLQRALIICAASCFLFKTESKTSMFWLCASTMLGIISMQYRLKHKKVLLCLIFLMAACGGAFAVHFWDYIAAFFDNEDSLTGRVQIWPLLIEYSKENWLFGSGFGSFWNIAQPSPIENYTQGWIAGITSGHNGYIDVLVQTGVPGLVLAIVAAVVAPARRYINGAVQDQSRRALLISVTFFAVGHNLTESSIFNRDSTINVILMLAIALLGVESRRPRTKNVQH